MLSPKFGRRADFRFKGQSVASLLVQRPIDICDRRGLQQDAVVGHARNPHTLANPFCVDADVDDKVRDLDIPLGTNARAMAWATVLMPNLALAKAA